ncbi:MAG: hypothetical protein AB1452_17165, partial [Pseudomonadota bacterium]
MWFRLLLVAAIVAMAGAPAQAQRRYTNEEIVGRIAECMKESAPEDWKRLIFTLDEKPGNRGKVTGLHQAIAGSANGAPREIKPCRRPDWVSRAVQTFRETQDEKARRWTGITLAIERDGRYTINF